MRPPALLRNWHTSLRPVIRASNEQAGGVSDVHQAVSTPDRMTQESSAMIEQTTEAVEALHPRSDTLKRSLAVFRA